MEAFKVLAFTIFQIMKVMKEILFTAEWKVKELSPLKMVIGMTASLSKTKELAAVFSFMQMVTSMMETLSTINFQVTESTNGMMV
jgi:hypothetical protein